METKFKNRGVLVGDRSTDYRAGLVSGNLPYEVRTDGNYEPWLPPGEWQANDDGDSMSCVSFGALNAIETEEKRQTGKQINYSDRWIAKMSGTTKQGNYLWKVLDAIREYGLVEEKDYPAPKNYTWDEYHTEISEPLLSQLKIKGRAWLAKWDVGYEWVDISPQSLEKHLKHAPLIVIVPGHLVMNYRVITNIKQIFDSYSPWKKQVPGDYSDISHAMKIVLTPREQVDPDRLLVNIEYGEFGNKVIKLLKALRRLGWGVKEHTESWGELYDDQVKDLVFRFQLANLPRVGWAWWWNLFFYRGRMVDETTRNIVNNLLTKQK